MRNNGKCVCLKLRLIMKCQFCGQENDDSAKFCFSCGKTLGTANETTICRYCGTVLPKNAKFCDCRGKILTDNNEIKSTNTFNSGTEPSESSKVTIGENHQDNNYNSIDINHYSSFNKKIQT